MLHLINVLFEGLRARYVGLLDWSLHHRAPVLTAFMAFFVASLGLASLIGKDFFPNVDSGQMKLHARAPAGTRIEETELRFAAIESEIRQALPAERTRHDYRQHRNPEQLVQPGARRYPHHLERRRRDPDLAQQRAPFPRDYEVLLRKRLQENFRIRFLFPAGQYHNSDPELRSACAARFAGGWTRRRSEL